MSDNKFTGQIRVSASRIKSLKQCSYKFYLNEYEKLPETTHPKTVAGLLCHSVFECLKNQRHRKIYDTIVATGSYHGTPIDKLVEMWQIKHSIAQEIIDPVDEMLQVGLAKIDFFHSTATQVFPPEHEFKIILKNGIVKGFIDDLSFHGPVAKIRDYKSQKNKFTKAELLEEPQATVYQLYVWKAFQMPAEVEFVMLRHPPTKRHPNLHLQIVPPKTKEQLEGFEVYLNHIAVVMKNYGLENAMSDFAADDKDRKGFCQYVCQFKDPFDYQCVTKDGVLVKNYSIDEDVKLADGEKLEIRKHNGCPRFHSIS